MLEEHRILTARSQKADYYHLESFVSRSAGSLYGKQLSRSVFPQKLAISFAC